MYSIDFDGTIENNRKNTEIADNKRKLLHKNSHFTI